jgi:hypothetical protein
MNQCSDYVVRLLHAGYSTSYIDMTRSPAIIWQYFLHVRCEGYMITTWSSEFLSREMVGW